MALTQFLNKIPSGSIDLTAETLIMGGWVCCTVRVKMTVIIGKTICVPPLRDNFIYQFCHAKRYCDVRGGVTQIL